MLNRLFFIVFLFSVNPVWAQGNIQASGANINGGSKEKISLSLNIVPAMPIEDCATDERCEVYLYLHPGDGKNYISNIDVKTEWPPSSATQISEFKVKGDIVKKNISLIHARTPEQCIRDEVCVWYAFRETALSAHNGDPYTLKITRQINTPVKWGYIGLGQKSVKNEIESLMQQMSQSVPFSITYEDQENAANLLFITTDKMEEALSTYQRDTQDIRFFENYNSQGFEHILNHGQYRAFSKIAKKTKSSDIFAVMGNGTEDKILLPARLMTLFGFRPNLSKFPLSVLNNPAEATMPTDIVPLTVLDLLMLRIFYAPEFNEPMSATQARQRFHEVYIRESSKF